MRQNLVIPLLIKQGSGKFSVATPDTQLLAISTSKATENKLNNHQKQEIYKMQNSECASTHLIGKAMSIYCYCEYLSGNHKIKLILLLCLVLL